MRADNLHSRANRISGNSDRKLQKSDKMKIEVDSILMDVRDITGVVHEAIINLENYGSNDHHTQLPIALREATIHLNAIRQRSQNIPKGESAMQCANEQFEVWSDELTTAKERKQKLDQFMKLRDIFNNKYNDLKNLTHLAFRHSSETEGFLTKNRKSIDKLEEKKNQLNNDREELEKMVNLDIIAESDSMMETLHDAIAKLRIDNKDLIELNIEIDSKIRERDEELREIQSNLIPEAQKHAEDLSRRSKIIVGLFQNSKDGAQVAMLAGTAHQNITEAINAARIAADKAHEAAVFSNDKLNPIDADKETLIEKGKDLSLESEAIQADAEEQIRKIKGKIEFSLSSLQIFDMSRDFNSFSDLKEMLNYQQTIVKNTSNQIRSSGESNNLMSAQITKLSNSGTRKSVEESSVLAEEILGNMNDLEKETKGIDSDVDELNKKLEELDPEWDSKYGMAEENVSKSQINIREANNTWNVHEPVFRQQNEKFQRWNESFSLKLQELRDKIAQAKHAAEAVS